MNQQWKNAGPGDKYLLECVSILLSNNKHILSTLFLKTKPKLAYSPNTILREYSGLCISEYLLVKIALDFWSGSGNAYLWEVLELLDLKDLELVIKSMSHFKAVHEFQS